MTTTFDPRHPAYTEEADVRLETARVHDVCHGCRRCVDLCAVFPTLFEMIDAMAEPASNLLTPAQQDRVTDECVHCTMCAVGCPHDEDVPRLMLRARAMQFENDHLPAPTKAAARVLSRPDRIGRLVSLSPRIANQVVRSRPGSRSRRLLARLAGISADVDLGRFALERFSHWFRERPTIRLRRGQASITLFPTCIVEHQATSIGKDLVKVLERNGVECAVSEARCCGATLLHAGDLASFTKVAESNMADLAAEIRAGTDIVVPEPACVHVLTVDSLDHLVTDQAKEDAALVAEHTFDAASYLMGLHRADDFVLDTDFSGEIHRDITYMASPHTSATRAGFPGRDLMRLTGASIEVVPEPLVGAGLWSMRAGYESNATHLGLSDGDDSDGGAEDGDDDAGGVTRRAGTIVVSDSYLAGLAITPDGDDVAMHPVQVIARAYGIPVED